MPKLLVNDQSVTFTPESTLKTLLEQLGYSPNNVAVAINGEFVPRRNFGNYQLKENLQLDVVLPMQGG